MKRLTKAQWEEVVLRAQAAAKAGRSIHSNPYDLEAQRDQWHVWRFAYADVAEPDSEG